MLIVPELDNEMDALRRSGEMQARVQTLQTEREGLQRSVDGKCMRRLELRRELDREIESAAGSRAELELEMRDLEAELERLHAKINTLNREIGPALRQAHELPDPNPSPNPNPCTPRRVGWRGAGSVAPARRGRCSR